MNRRRSLQEKPLFEKDSISMQDLFDWKSPLGTRPPIDPKGPKENDSGIIYSCVRVHYIFIFIQCTQAI